jgi:hypothetical protein
MSTWIKGTSAALLLVTAVTSLPVNAEMVSTRSALAESEGKVTTGLASLSSQRAELQTFLARADIKAQLSQMGVDPADASLRVAALSDAQVQDLHGRLQQMPAGGDILGVVVFVFLVLLVTDILGLTHVFPFTRSIRH